MYRLHNPVQRYDWGSTEHLPRLLGVDPDGTPQAELWMGAHPLAPSRALVHGRWVPLDELIAADPDAMVGSEVRARFGETLPFLLKVLAAAHPLSLQVHPDQAQARAGFEREDRAGIARDAPQRSYRDANHKPELLCALNHFDVLSGFRSSDVVASVLDAFGLGQEWADLARRVEPGELCGVLWDLPPSRQRDLAVLVDHAASRLDGAALARWGPEAELVRRLAAWYPGDVGVVIALCMNRLRLQAGQAMFASAGRLHAYLDGVGVEIMANSDNVVRGGLTSKAVDVAELRRLLLPGADATAPIDPVIDELSGEAVLPVFVDEFALSSFSLDGDRLAVPSPGPEILLCVDGGADVASPAGSASLERGGSLFVPASSARYELRGAGTIYRARVGLLARSSAP